MKKVFSKELWKKFLASMMVVMSLMCIMPERVHAIDIGGEIMQPVVDLFVGMGDGAVNIIHRIIKGQSGTLIRFGNSKKLIQLGEFGKKIAYITQPSLYFGKLTLQRIVNDNAESLSKTKLGKIIVKKLGNNSAGGVIGYDPEDIDDDILVLPLYTVTPEEIFGGTIGLFNVNFFDTSLRESNNDMNATADKKETNIAEELQPVIAAWYKIIRGIATVGMLSMIVYIGIRILISSTSENKAKYKQLLVDWGVGFCLLFVMHYGMAFGNMFVDSLTDAITSVRLYGGDSDGNTITLEDGDTVTASDIKSVNKSSMTLLIPKEKIENYIDEEDGKIKFKDVTVDQEIEEIKLNVESDDGTETKEMTFITWNTGLMGKLRFDTAIARDTSDSYIGYSLLFLVLVFFIIFFTWTYLKRVLYMAFLTIIAPFVALTYPLDKIKDGQAQAFNFWLKEYIYNLLLQPLHLLLYTVLVSSVIELATEHIIYSIVALGFLVPAEKLIRQMFGFKGNTPGLLPGAAGAALVMTGMKNLLAKAPDEKDNKIDVPKSDNKAKMKDVDYSAILGNGGTTPSLGQSPDGFPQNQVTPAGLPAQNVTPAISTPDLASLGQSPDGFPQNQVTPAGLPAQNVTPAISTPDYASFRQATNAMQRNGARVSTQVRSVKPGISPYAKQIGRNVGRRISNRVKKIKPTRFIAGATLGALGAGIGLAAGIASGDAGKALTYASTGAIAGNKAGRGVASVFGVEEAINAVDQSYMTNEERKQYEAKKKLKSDEYRLQMDREDKRYKAILDKKMADGRTIREATLGDGLTHEEQMQFAKYAYTNYNDFGMLTNEKYENADMAQRFYEQATGIRDLSNTIGVTNFDALDSKTQQAKKELIAKQVNSNYSKLKKQKKILEEQKAAVGQGGGMTDDEIAKRRFNIQEQIENIEKSMVSDASTQEVVNKINMYGKIDE